MTKRAAVVGHPISHSRSPALHRAAYQACGLDWSYQAIDLAEADFPAFVRQLDSSWAGLSITMPLKRLAAESADHLEGLTKSLGVANTILFGPAGAVAVNTDVHGIVAALKEAGLPPGPATILGGGATAAAALAAVAQLGVSDQVVWARSAARSRELLAAAARMGLKPGLRKLRQDGPGDWPAPLVIATLPPTAADGLARRLAAATAAGVNPVPEGGVLLDVAYDPWPSALAEAWQAGGGKVVSGLSMLLHQAAEQFRLMTGLAAPLEAMRAALR
ncbi:MAG: shikimate dehydrogenase [Bifidobacteriaceae bacterium]|nr:shikimate dehydrogenase [Bifidobacteriaceae bacterium]